MTIKKWDDGASMAFDPTRDDPLYYYLPESDWDFPIGFEILPFRAEETSNRVTINVFNEFTQNFLELDKEAATAFTRIISTLLEEFPHWTELHVGFENVPSDLKHDLRENIKRLGFSQGVAQDGSEQFLKGT